MKSFFVLPFLSLFSAVLGQRTETLPDRSCSSFFGTSSAPSISRTTETRTLSPITFTVTIRITQSAIPSTRTQTSVVYNTIFTRLSTTISRSLTTTIRAPRSTDTVIARTTVTPRFTQTFTQTSTRITSTTTTFTVTASAQVGARLRVRKERDSSSSYLTAVKCTNKIQIYTSTTTTVTVTPNVATVYQTVTSSRVVTIPVTSSAIRSFTTTFIPTERVTARTITTLTGATSTVQVTTIITRVATNTITTTITRTTSPSTTSIGAANLVMNGRFTSGAFAPWSTTTSGVAYFNIVTPSTAPAPAAIGTAVAQCNISPGTSSSKTNSNAECEITQSMATVVGATYNVSYYWTANAESRDKLFSYILIGGVNEAGQSREKHNVSKMVFAGKYVQVSFSYKAVGSKTTLEIGVGDSSGSGSLIRFGGISMVKA